MCFSIGVVQGGARGNCSHDWPKCENGEKRRRPDEMLGSRRCSLIFYKFQFFMIVIGQTQYRSEWGRYTRGCNVIVFVVDANSIHTLPDVKIELHRLLEDRELQTTPLLVVANKIDLTPHASEKELINALNLDYIVDNPWIIIPCSALRNTNVDEIIQWLIRQADGKKHPKTGLPAQEY